MRHRYRRPGPSGKASRDWEKQNTPKDESPTQQYRTSRHWQQTIPWRMKQCTANKSRCSAESRFSHATDSVPKASASIPAERTVRRCRRLRLLSDSKSAKHLPTRYEGGCQAFIPSDMNKWCARECESVGTVEPTHFERCIINHGNTTTPARRTQIDRT